MDYRLLTVIYGTAAASYLALWVLDQLDDEGAEFSLAIPVLRHQTYVDDCFRRKRPNSCSPNTRSIDRVLE